MASAPSETEIQACEAAAGREISDRYDPDGLMIPDPEVLDGVVEAHPAATSRLRFLPLSCHLIRTAK
jgi:hypothetical protein